MRKPSKLIMKSIRNLFGLAIVRTEKSVSWVFVSQIDICVLFEKEEAYATSLGFNIQNPITDTTKR